MQKGGRQTEVKYHSESVVCQIKFSYIVLKMF